MKDCFYVVDTRIDILGDNKILLKNRELELSKKSIETLLSIKDKLGNDNEIKMLNNFFSGSEKYELDNEEFKKTFIKRCIDYQNLILSVKKCIYFDKNIDEEIKKNITEEFILDTSDSRFKLKAVALIFMKENNSQEAEKIYKEISSNYDKFLKKLEENS